MTRQASDTPAPDVVELVATLSAESTRALGGDHSSSGLILTAEERHRHMMLVCSAEDHVDRWLAREESRP